MGKDGPSLELPSLGFGRRRRKQKTGEAGEVGERPQPGPDPAPRDSPTTILEADDLPGDRPAEARVETPVTPSAPVTASLQQPVEPPAPVTASVEPPVVPAATEPTATRTRPASPAEAAAPPLLVEETAPEGGAHAAPAPQRPRRTLPAIGGMAAAAVTGVLVGVITVGLTWGSLHLCEVVEGTSSCGGPGFLLLVAIMVAMILLGSLLLRAWGVPDPGSTSFLAVGLLAVLALLFLIDVLFSWSMIIVIPLISAGTFALSHWVTTAFGEPTDR